MRRLRANLLIMSGLQALWFSLPMVIAFAAQDAGAISDPTRPSGYAPAVAAKSGDVLKLESVLIARNRRVAVINGKTCRVGDSVNGARLVAIHADGAELVRDGSRVVLPLLKIQVRR
jgi:hypothetical protein